MSVHTEAPFKQVSLGHGSRPAASSPAQDRATPEKEKPAWTPRVELSAANKADFGQRPLAATHNLHQSELFTDAALIDLLDHFPRQNLYALTMGTDLTRPD